MNVAAEFIQTNAGGSQECGGDCSAVSGWNFFSPASSSITGVVSSLLERLDLILTQKLPPAQLGVGANEEIGSFGFSMWFG